MKKNILKLTAVLAVFSLPISTSAQIVQVDDFSGDLSAYTDTRILQADENASDNVYSWEIINGALHINTTSYGGIEQFALTRTDFSLDVGYELMGTFAPNYTGSQDIGLYLGAGHPTADVREDYVNIYMRDNGQLFSRGFDGTSELDLSGGGSPAVDALFIARTADDTFELGWYEEGARNVLVVREMGNLSIGDAIGFYADVRSDGIVGSFENLSIVPEPSTYALIFGAAVLGIALYRRHLKA